MKAMDLLCRTVNVIQFFTEILREFKGPLNLSKGPSLIRFLALVDQISPCKGALLQCGPDSQCREIA